MSCFNLIGHIVHFIFKMAPNHNVIIHIHPELGHNLSNESVLVI